MDLSVLFKRVGKVAAENSPAILTAIGVTGTLTTAYLAAKGAFKAAELIAEETAAKREHLNEPELELDTKEKFDLTWDLYVPAAMSAGMTVIAIICAHRIGERRTAALASAYSVVREGFTEYRAKTAEKVGKTKEQAIRDEIAQERRDRNPVNQASIIVTGKGDTLCYDAWNDRYFTSSKNQIDAAVNEFNKTVIHQTHAPLSEFYHLLGVRAPKESEEVGYDTDKFMELDFSGTLTEDGTPCLVFDFKVLPDYRYSARY